MSARVRDNYGNLSTATASNEQGSEPGSLAGGFEDALLVRQVQAGSTEAFSKLVCKYQDRVYNTCWRITGHGEDARDLTQDVFLKAFERIGGFKGKSGFYTWLFRIAVNRSISHRRKGRRVLSMHAGGDGDGDLAVAADLRVPDSRTDDPMAVSMNSETAEQTAAALQDIEPDYRVVLVLRDVEGLDYQQIADVLEIAVGTVKSRIFRGRMAMRKILADGNDE